VENNLREKRDIESQIIRCIESQQVDSEKINELSEELKKMVQKKSQLADVAENSKKNKL